MSKTVAQIFATNPTTVVADTDLYYLVQSPYTPGTDAAITGASLKAAFGSGGTINPGLINQLAYYAAAGSTLSGLATLASGTLVTSAGGVPSISQTLPNAVQLNITALGTIATGTWNATTIGPTFGGTGIATYTLGDTLYASAVNTLSKLAGNTTAVKNFLAQTGTGVASAAPVWSTISASDVGSGQALTKTDDTNVTLTLGGTPTTALLTATSLTLGWTGTLSGTKGGTGVNNGASTITVGGSFAMSGAFTFTGTLTGNTAVTFPTSGTLATTSQIPTGAALTKTDDTNVTLTLGGSPTTALVNAASLTLGWTGQLSVSRGGTGLSSITAHDLIIGNGTSAATLLAPSATSGVPLISQGASADPAYGTAVVAGGGTGATSFTAYAVVCGGTTSTGALQSIASVGTSGQVLTSNGAGALPTMQDLPAGSSFVVQQVRVETGAVATGTTQIPADDTIPQNTEGDQYMTLSITPTNSSHILVIDVVFFGSPNANTTSTIALFQDSTANALAAVGASGNSNQSVTTEFKHIMTAGTTSSTTFKVRAGIIPTATTQTFNGSISARRYGGVAASSIVITEYTS